MDKPAIEYDDEADVLYVRFDLAADVDRTVMIDDLRLVDLSVKGSVVGIEFIDASDGVDLCDLPLASEAEKLINGSGWGIPVFA